MRSPICDFFPVTAPVVRFGSVLSYDESSGAFLGTYVGFGTGGLSAPADPAFVTDGMLLVASGTGDIFSYGLGEMFHGARVTAGSGGLGTPLRLVIPSLPEPGPSFCRSWQSQSPAWPTEFL